MTLVIQKRELPYLNLNFHFPTPVLPGSGKKSMFSARNFGAPHLN